MDAQESQWIKPHRTVHTNQSIASPVPRPPIACLDLDGTLLDPNGSIRATIDQVLVEHGLEPFDPETRRLIGLGLRDIYRLRTNDDALIERMTHRYREVFTQDGWRLARFYPGIPRFLQSLHDDGWRLAVVTTKGEQEAVDLLRNVNILDLFETVVGDDDVRPIKPHPAPVETACMRLGQRPTREGTVMVGDTTFDIEAGRAAGTWTIGVLWGHGEQTAMQAVGVDAVAKDVDHLEQLLRAWAKP